MSELNDSTVVVSAEDTLSTTLDGESVLLQTSSGTYFGFNQVGTHIWELLSEPHSVEQVTQSVVEQYDVERPRCQADIESLLSELIEKELVRVVHE